MKLVIAGNYSQYKEYLRENKLTDHKDAVYIDNTVRMRGRINCEVIFYGKYHMNPVFRDPDLPTFKKMAEEKWPRN
jgi:hypothetical protein